MPKQYTAMRDKFAQTMSYDAAQARAARIYNARHPKNPVGNSERKALAHALRKGK